jgi:hypothetical protein
VCFILDQIFSSFARFQAKKYFRFAGGKAET